MNAERKTRFGHQYVHYRLDDRWKRGIVQFAVRAFPCEACTRPVAAGAQVLRLTSARRIHCAACVALHIGGYRPHSNGTSWQPDEFVDGCVLCDLDRERYERVVERSGLVACLTCGGSGRVQADGGS